MFARDNLENRPIISSTTLFKFCGDCYNKEAVLSQIEKEGLYNDDERKNTKAQTEYESK